MGRMKVQVSERRHRIVEGTVIDCGGGEFRVLVDRNTDDYPPVKARTITLAYWNEPVDVATLVHEEVNVTSGSCDGKPFVRIDCSCGLEIGGPDHAMARAIFNVHCERENADEEEGG